MGLRSAKLVLAASVLAVAAVVPAQGATIFSDDFSTSTIPTNTAYPTPTSTSTGYAIACAKTATTSIATGDLSVTMGAATSGITNVQALFTTTPITLATVGDTIQLTIVFRSTSTILPTTDTNGQLDIGLFNSGGSAPATDLANAGLSNTLTNDANGGAKGWMGNVGRTFSVGTSNSAIASRVAQTGTTNVVQEVLTNGASSSQSSNSPAGATITSSNTQNVNLTDGSIYTDDLLLTLTSATTLSIVHSLYAGSTASGTPISTLTANANTAQKFPTATFDAFAMGWRHSGTANVATTIDYQSVLVQANIQSVPEPASLGVLAVGGLGLLVRRRKA